MLLQQINNLSDFPNVLSDSRFHRRGTTQGLMNPAKIIVHEMERDGVLQVIDLLRKGVSQPGKPSHAHAHSQILPFNVAGRNELGIGSAVDDVSSSPDASRRTVSRVAFWRVPVEFNQHRVIHPVPAECTFDGGQLRPVPGAGDLDAVRETRC